jgi:UDPglucose 6-dehydrogenase
VRAFDPAVTPAGPAAGGPRSFHVVGSVEEATTRADAVVVATGWPQFRELDLGVMAGAMHGDLLVDARGVLDERLAAEAGLRLVGVGRSARHGGATGDRTSASSVSLTAPGEEKLRSAVG